MKSGISRFSAVVVFCVCIVIFFGDKDIAIAVSADGKMAVTASRDVARTLAVKPRAPAKS